MKTNIELPGFDTQDALDKFGGDRVLLIKYVSLMIKDLDKRLPLLGSMLNNHDFENAKIELHTMRGTASALSATHLISLCLECEKSCQQKLDQQSLHIYMELKCAVDLIRQAI
ncbi:Hpt domain-containing protein [Limnobacter thiooxidans]|uniref:HPt domain-containing protein n=1 Tax=Limnobacter thiooxidans TaxID=131080 RepID=A0AA86J0W6_9BURK|nr:Hpt domain-containing protein [Limnobacter sp.]MCZ8014800.1 Hpt domain-containing protein [Limnobacter sp.]RZS40548.1 Hpt domain-containing protein [Limnobacter thiooxidans]BET27018.1 hypothetical protein RGQ30_25190 [Limnobacter thiooxidans]